MGPEDKDEIDDILAEDEVNDVLEDKGSKKDASEQEEAPKDIRGAIKHAIKEHSEDDDKSQEDKKPSKVQVRAKATKDVSDKSEDQQESDEADDSEVKQPQVKEEIPPYYKNKGKAVWDKLSGDERRLIIAREKEVSDGFKTYSEKAKSFDELDAVLKPHDQDIQRFGTTRAATIDRLFQWMTAISHQDLNYRVNAFNALAQSFGVPLERLVKQKPQIQDDNDADPADQQQTNQPPEWFQQYAQSTEQRLQETQNVIATQQRDNANKFLMEWAKDKPHFEAVKPRMHALIASGVVPPKNGEIDLDEAYRQATMSDPTIAALIQQEQKEKDKIDAQAKAAKEAKDKAAKVLRAKSAGSSVQPRAPSLTADAPKGKKPNGVGGKAVSVRDSIRQSLDQLRDDAN